MVYEGNRGLFWEQALCLTTNVDVVMQPTLQRSKAGVVWHDGRLALRS